MECAVNIAQWILQSINKAKLYNVRAYHLQRAASIRSKRLESNPHLQAKKSSLRMLIQKLQAKIPVLQWPSHEESGNADSPPHTEWGSMLVPPVSGSQYTDFQIANRFWTWKMNSVRHMSTSIRRKGRPVADWRQDRQIVTGWQCGAAMANVQAG